MARDAPRNNLRLLAPEVVQTSAMDCGPATLKCLLEGFGIPVSYGRLREACHTDVDGTSIDTIEDVARQLGLQAEQMILPADHLLEPAAEALPALVVTRLPSGAPHFVVVWSKWGDFVQVMNPASGRQWLSSSQLGAMLYRHTMAISAAEWRAWAGEDGYQAPLRARLDRVLPASTASEALLAAAAADPTWQSLAVLDAATRMTASLIRAGALQRGSESRGFLTRLVEQGRQGAAGNLPVIIPAPYWSVQPAQAVSQGADSVATLLFHGVVIVRVRGRQMHTAAGPIRAGEHEPALSAQPTDLQAEPSAAVALSPELAAALAEAPSRPEWEVWRALRADGLLTPVVLVGTLLLASLGVVLEAVLLRGLVQVVPQANADGQPINVLGMVLLFVLAMLLLELPIAAATLRMGRRLETRLRIALLEKMPRLSDRYFHSRLLSDMAHRAHNLRTLRTAPELGVRLLRTTFQLLLTAVGLILLLPSNALPALLAVGTAIGGILLVQPLINERSARVRTHTSALSRFYLDGLLGLVALRSHAAERALRREQEDRLTEWLRASLGFFDISVLMQAGQLLVGTIFTVWIVIAYLVGGGMSSGVLLLIYWAMSLPTLAMTLADLAQQYPDQRNQMLRLLEPLAAPEADGQGELVTVADPVPAGLFITAEPAVQLSAATAEPVLLARPAGSTAAAGLALRLEDVTVQAGGHIILRDVNLSISAGEQVAIVGASGAGKSTLIGLLLGWHRPAAGQVMVDEMRLTPPLLDAMRQVTAWVDPAVQIWNRSLLDNLRYGAAAVDSAPLGDVLELAELYGVIERLPNGLQTQLGEGGGLVSGGEGQRVRLGRAFFRPGVRLALLDEPFRGLDRSQRRQLLASAQQHWQGSTLLCVTHDVGETQSFDRVLVIDQGRIVEDDTPAVLAARPDSHYTALLAGEMMVRSTLWQGAGWRRLWVEDGRLRELQ